jgi:hypothetical protein
MILGYHHLIVICLSTCGISHSEDSLVLTNQITELIPRARESNNIR